MNIFIIPSWYPSDSNPLSGIFFKEQAIALANQFKDLNIAISTWGQNDERLLLWSKEPIKSLSKLLKPMPEQSINLLNKNLHEYFTPAFTWSRKVVKGNIFRIVEANEFNLLQFQGQTGKVDVIHAHVAYPGGYIAMRLSKKYNIPFVITEHMSPFPFSTFIKREKLSEVVKAPMNRAAVNIAVSHALKDKMERLGIKSIVIPNLVDQTQFTLKETKTTLNAIELLSVGRLEEQKGYFNLLEAFQLVRQKHPEIKLNIIGEGSLKSQLIEKTLSLKLQNAVNWLGQQTREEVNQAMQNSSFFVLSSLHENLPLALLEALACGKPVISTICGGPEECIDDSNGILVPPKDISALADAMEKMITIHTLFDSQKIRSQFEERFSSKVVCNNIRKVYEEVIKSHRRNYLY